MSEGILERLRYHAKDDPEKMVSVYPGDVIEAFERTVTVILPPTNNLKEILIAIRNLDYDHFDEAKIARARGEIKALLDCDDWDLNELLEQLLGKDKWIWLL